MVLVPSVPRTPRSRGLDLRQCFPELLEGHKCSEAGGGQSSTSFTHLLRAELLPGAAQVTSK